jgi:hypothetical protein
MKSTLYRMGRVIGLSAAVLVACEDDTPVFQGGVPGPAASLELSRSGFELRHGEAATFQGRLRDAAGNPVAGTVSVTSCGAGVATVTSGGTADAGWNSAFTVTGAGLGSTCLIASGEGLSDTADVLVGPAAIVITGPDTGSSGTVGPYSYTLQALDASGNAVVNPFPWSWAESDATLFRAAIQPAGVHQDDSLDFSSPGKIGIARVMATTVGRATAVRLVTISPTPFTGGTIAPSNALTRPGIDTLLVTRPAGTIVTFRSNTVVYVDGVAGFLTFPAANLANTPQGNPATSVVTAGVRMPPLSRTGVVPVVIANMGTANIYRIGSITAGASATNTTDATEPANDAALTTPAGNTFSSALLTSTAVPSPVGFAQPANFYFMFPGADCAAGVGGAGSDCVDWFAFTNTSATSRTLTVQATWFTNTDIDVNAFAADGTTSISTSGSTRGLGTGNASPGEGYDVPVAAGVTVRFRVQMHDANGVPVTMGRLRFIIS